MFHYYIKWFQTDIISVLFCTPFYVINVKIPRWYLFTQMLVGWLCFTSHRQRGHLETAPPFTFPCKGREAR